MRRTARNVYQGCTDPGRTEELRYADCLGNIWGCCGDAAVSGAGPKGNYCQSVGAKLRHSIGDRNDFAVPLAETAVPPIAAGGYRPFGHQYVPTFMLLRCAFHDGDDLFPAARHHGGMESQADMFAGEDFIDEQILDAWAYRV